MIQSYPPSLYHEIRSYLEQEEKEGDFDTISYLLHNRRCDLLGESSKAKRGPYLNRN
jgi:hypothetical protein